LFVDPDVGAGLSEDVVTGAGDADGALVALELDPELVKPAPQPASTAQRARIIAKRHTGGSRASGEIRT
jgi:hypothetical protein